MSGQMAGILLAAAIAFIVPLAGYAVHLHFEALRRQRIAKETHAKEAEQAREKIMESLSVLARALLDDQVNLTEAGIRIRVLLDLLPEDGPAVSAELQQVFDDFWQQAKDFATHEARESLEPAERESQDAARQTLEATYQSRLHQAAEDLLAWCAASGFHSPQTLGQPAAAR